MQRGKKEGILKTTGHRQNVISYAHFSLLVPPQLPIALGKENWLQFCLICVLNQQRRLPSVECETFSMSGLTKLFCLIKYCQLHSSATLLGSPAVSPRDFFYLSIHTSQVLRTQMSHLSSMSRKTHPGVWVVVNILLSIGIRGANRNKICTKTENLGITLAHIYWLLNFIIVQRILINKT